MAETSGHVSDVRPGMFRTMAALLADRLGMASRLGWSYNGERILHDVLGYKQTLRYADFKARYERQDLAHACVHAYPDATWSQPPTVREDDQDDAETAFEAAWNGLVTRLGVYRTLKRTDVLANLGHYAVLLIGLRGQSNLQVPATPVRGPEDVIFLQPYSEEGAQIEQFEDNVSLPTYGQPRLYRLQTQLSPGNQRTPQPRGMLVHASRVLHVAEDLVDDDIYGVPRLQPIFDQLDNLLKVVGGGAEGFWRDARRRIAVLLRDGFHLSEEDSKEYKEQVEKYGMGWTDFLSLGGSDIQQLTGHVASPKDHFDTIVSCIAGTLGIPKAMLLGAERGTLASAEEESQDWKERIVQRQHQFAEPVLLRSLIDRLLALGAMPAPAQPYTVTWGNLLALSEPQQAQVAKDKASAIQQYEAARVGALHAGVEPTVPVPEFRETVLGLPAQSPYAVEMPALVPSDEGVDLPHGPRLVEPR